MNAEVGVGGIHWSLVFARTGDGAMSVLGYKMMGKCAFGLT